MKKALQERFEPSCRKERYQAQFQTRKKKEEGWADFADSLRTLVDKAYPDLEDNAKEQLALNHFVSQIENCQVAFSVRQKRPKTVDEAVSATLEMEAYIDAKTISSVVDVRPVGWSEDGGVRESNKVELIKSGGGSRRGHSPLSPS